MGRTVARGTLICRTIGALALGACGSDAGPAAGPATDGGTLPIVPTTTVSEALGGFGPQRAAPGEFDHVFSTTISATLRQDGRGCWSLEANGEDLFVVLPQGFELDPGGRAMVAPDGAVMPDGTVIVATGALLSVDGLPGGADGRWGDLLAFCRPDATAVVVTDELAVDDFDPATLDDDALADLVAGAEFTVDWPCGLGFATSTEDQRVGLYVDPVDLDQPAPGAVSLPDDRWRATVVVGEHLFVNHCDDVVEWFEPERRAVASYPLTSGTFEVTLPEPGTDPTDRPVTIVLEGAVVEGPTGSITLGTVAIANDAYGFFAG